MTGSNPPNLVAIDLGAESCRVSLLQWREDTPHIELVHRFNNSAVTIGEELHWDSTAFFPKLSMDSFAAQRKR